MNNYLIQNIPPTIEAGLKEMLLPEEVIFVKLKGAFKEVLVCTDKRVIILKSGFQTGQWFGLSQFQLPLASVTSAQISVTLGVGFIEISAGGVQNTPKSYWATSKANSAQKAPNCVSLASSNRKGIIEAFRAASNLIMQKADDARRATMPTAKAPTSDVSSSLATLWQMKNEGALTQEEFESAKAKLIS